MVCPLIAALLLAYTPVPIDLDGNPCEVVSFPSPTTAYDYTKLKREKLGRGLVAWRSSTNEVTVSWRYLETDPLDIAFDLYQDDILVAFNLRSSTQITLPLPASTSTFTLIPSSSIRKFENSQFEYSLDQSEHIGYINIPLNVPSGGTTPDGVDYTYDAEEASVGDVDGDGEMEIILRWDPTNSKDNAHSGYSGNCLIDCYRLNGEFLWRIDFGINIRSGSHYNQFMVGDFDGDGKAEMIAKTADGTIDGLGNVIGDATADYRTQYGYILSGPEYLTVFNGLTGEAIDTVGYLPERGPIEEWKWTKERGWGDQYGNRVDRFLATPAYLDGEHLSCVMCRGYYKRSALTAWDFNGTNLICRWLFDTTNTLISTSYQGQGFHNIRCGDVDFDGKDEIVYGQMVVDHDGSPLYSTGLGHGDAMHLLQMDPLKRGMQVFSCQEASPHGLCLRDAGTGEILFHKGAGGDTGRGVAGDISPDSWGCEMWGASGLGMYSAAGNYLGSADNISWSFLCWWTGDMVRNSLPGANIDTYDLATHSRTRITDWRDVEKSNGTKSTPVFSGDIYGDWREEVIVRTTDGASLRVYLSPEPTEYRFHTFLHDPVYRHSLAQENVAYNQPPHPSFYFGPDLKGHKLIFRGGYIP